MDPPNRYYFEPLPQLESPDPSSATAPPIPLDPNSDSASPRITIVGDEYTYDGIRWHVWDRSTVSYIPPRPEDLPCPPTSLVDPHGWIRAARANITGNVANTQVEQTRSYPIRPARPSRTASASTSNDIVQQPPPSERPRASSLLASRSLELQIERYATQLQATARPEDQKAVINAILREEAPTPQAIRQHYRRTAARNIEQARAREETWESERAREGMLFGSELVRGRQREGRPDDDAGQALTETEVD